MFWNLLIGVCFFAALGSAWDAGAATKMSVGGHIVAAVTGLVIGAACAFAMWRVGEIVGARALKLQPESRQRWYIRGLYISSIFWIFLAVALGRWAALGLLRLLT